MSNAQPHRQFPRLVEVKRRTDGTKRTASGWMPVSGWVLTAAHAVTPGGTFCRPVGGTDWLQAEVHLLAGIDVALLRVDGLPSAPGRTVFAQYRGEGPLVDCRVRGYPSAAAEGSDFRAEQVTATLQALSGAHDDRLALDVTSALPSDPRDWRGLSGAAVLDPEGRLLGVVSKLPTAWTGRLTAVPASAIRDALRGWLAETERPGFPLPRLTAHGDRPEVLAPLEDGLADTSDVSEFELLTFRNQVVPFVELGRAEALASLLDWCGSQPDSADVKVRLLLGQAGSGKSRLAAELSRRLLHESEYWWHAGFAAGPDTWAGFHPARPLLIVFDYADERPEAIGRFLRELIELERRSELRQPVRAVLVSRARGDWLDKIDYAADGRLASRVRETSTIQLGQTGTVGDSRPDNASPGTLGPAARREHFDRAAEAFRRHAEAQSLPAQDVTAPHLEHQVYGTPLMIHIAALLATRGEPLPDPTGLPDWRDRMLDLLLYREELRWRRAARQAATDFGEKTFWELTDRDTDLAWRVLTLVTATAPTVAECAPLLAAVSDLATTAAVGTDAHARTQRLRRRIAKALHQLYPKRSADSPALAPIEPDLVAAHLMGRSTFADRPDSVDIISRLYRLDAFRVHHHDRLISTLAHTVDHHDTLADRVADHLTVPVGRPDDGLGANAVATYDRIPYPNRFLSRLGIRLAHLAADRHGADGDRYDQAVCLSQLGIRLDEAGQRHEAMTVTAQAVEILRSLDTMEPGAYSGELASALGNLGIHLAELGRLSEALTATQESVDIRRRLTDVDANVQLPRLAAALNNLGMHLAELGRPSEALTATQESVDIRRRLVESDPNAHLTDLAGSLNNLAMRLAEVGRHTEAIPVVEEAVDHFRRLVETGSTGFLPILASCLTNLGMCLAAAGVRHDAPAAAQEAVEIRHGLAEYNSDAYLPGLAASLNSLGLRLGDAGRRDEGIIALELSVDYLRRLVTDDPRAHLPRLASALNNLGFRLGDAGRHEDAVVVAREAVDRYRDLVDDEPNVHLPDLAAALHNLGIHLAETGRNDEALAVTRESVDCCRRLAESDPDTHLADLANALNNLGLVLSDTGHHDEAVTVAGDAVDRHRRLTADSQDTDKSDLASALCALAGVRVAAGADLEAALDAAWESTRLFDTLSQADPGAFDTELAEAFTTLAEVHEARGETEAAAEVRGRLEEL